MTDQAIIEGVTGGSPTVDSTALAEQIGTLAKALDDSAAAMREAKESGDQTRWHEQHEINASTAATLTELQSDYKERLREEATAKAEQTAAEMREFLAASRAPAKAIGATPFSEVKAYRKGDFLYAVHESRARDYDEQKRGKAMLASLVEQLDDPILVGVAGDGTEVYAKAATFQTAKDAGSEGFIPWGEAAAKSTLGTTDATGGWIIPNAVVDEFITPAAYANIYREIMTVVPGVTTAAVDIPFRSGVRSRAQVAAFGATKTNVDLAYNGYTATMYTIAAIYDIGNQFLRQSRGAAEADVLSELAAAFAAGESYYVREGSGSSEPFGYTSALTNGPAAFRSTFSSPSDSTLAGSMASAISVAAGALGGRGVTPDAAVMSATSYWQMLRQGSDNAGFWFATVANSPTSIRPGTLISPWGIPVYPDAGADSIGTAAVIDNLVVAQWKKFKIYFGQTYRVDSSDEAGTRWDTNLTGFRGEEEMGFDARPAVYAGYAQMITDIVP